MREKIWKDRILSDIKKYHDTHCTDKEVLITIQKAVDASPELRSKKRLIENFIAGIHDVDDVLAEWHEYVLEQREMDLMKIIRDENLREDETRKFMENSFRDGEIRTTGTDIDHLMPPVSRFGGGKRAEKKQGIIDKFKNFFNQYFGLANADFVARPEKNYFSEEVQDTTVVAEEGTVYGKEEHH